MKENKRNITYSDSRAKQIKYCIGCGSKLIWSPWYDLDTYDTITGKQTQESILECPVPAKRSGWKNFWAKFSEEYHYYAFPKNGGYPIRFKRHRDKQS